MYGTFLQNMDILNLKNNQFQYCLVVVVDVAVAAAVPRLYQQNLILIQLDLLRSYWTTALAVMALETSRTIHKEREEDEEALLFCGLCFSLPSFLLAS
jgi:hypothetical protein